MLNDIDLKDIYLGRPNAWLSGVPGTSDPFPAPEDCAEELEELRNLCDKRIAEHGKDEFTIRHKNVSYRASVLRSISDVVFVLRRFPAMVPAFDTIGLHGGYISKFMQPGLAGLIVIAGPFGAGKTTSASALIAARLSKFGGVAITIEDPPEMPLEGKHGEGVCYQTWVDRGGFGDATRKMARFAPSIIFLGEVRDSETAAEALRASINGRLVVCTTHADSVPMAIERIYSLANGASGSSEDTANLLASGLLCVAHQRLDGEPKHPKMSLLWLGDDDSHGIRNTIRQRRFDQIGSEVTLQLNRMMMGGRSAREG